VIPRAALFRTVLQGTVLQTLIEFRHPYSTLLRSVGADLKVMQELLRHSTIRVTLDTYTQAVTAAKRTAHTAVVSLIVGNDE
jgi:site-specific recombinase XerD